MAYDKGNPTEKQRKNWNTYRENHREEIRQQDRKRRGFKARIPKYSLEIHQQLAMNSGIETSREWFECYKLGLFPDGIYSDPQTIFKNPEDKQ